GMRDVTFGFILARQVRKDRSHRLDAPVVSPDEDGTIRFAVSYRIAPQEHRLGVEFQLLVAIAVESNCIGGRRRLVEFVPFLLLYLGELRVLFLESFGLPKDRY